MLIIDQVSKQFENGFIALDEVTLTINPSEIVSLVGTSGCGKSTLLRIIAGLDGPTLGQVCIDNEPVFALHPKVGIIFQEPRLMPWLTVQQNVQFGLAHLERTEANIITAATLEKVGLSTFAEALPRQLSGGMGNV